MKLTLAFLAAVTLGQTANFAGPCKVDHHWTDTMEMFKQERQTRLNGALITNKEQYPYSLVETSAGAEAEHHAVQASFYQSQAEQYALRSNEALKKHQVALDIANKFINDTFVKISALQDQITGFQHDVSSGTLTLSELQDALDEIRVMRDKTIQMLAYMPNDSASFITARTLLQVSLETMQEDEMVLLALIHDAEAITGTAATATSEAEKDMDDYLYEMQVASGNAATQEEYMTQCSIALMRYTEIIEWFMMYATTTRTTTVDQYGRVAGDPHIMRLDGTAFDLEEDGEHDLLLIPESGEELELSGVVSQLQARRKGMKGHYLTQLKVSGTSVGMRVIRFESEPFTIEVGTNSYTPATFPAVVELGKDSQLKRDGRSFIIETPKANIVVSWSDSSATNGFLEFEVRPHMILNDVAGVMKPLKPVTRIIVASATDTASPEETSLISM